MRFSTRPGFTALLALFVNWLFFFEYFPPFLRTFIPYDLEGYHYPIMDFAFREVRAGRLPEWDSGIYCGLPLLGNVQAALLYPPTWGLFLASLRNARLPYENLQFFVLLHVWLTFALGYAWLHGRRLHPVACWIGACVLAYSGYLMTQLQHLGLVCGLPWFALAFRGIDEASESGNWRPLWKAALASAMVFLAGYTPFWTVFAVCAAAYAIGMRSGWRTVTGLGVALAFSLLLASAQLWQSIEASGLMSLQSHYGAGERDLAKFYSFLLPNYYEWGLHVPRELHRGYDYWYIGSAGILGCLCAFRRSAWRLTLAALAIAGMTLLFMTNPFGAIGSMVERSALIASVIRSWYFMPGLTIALALLAAAGFDGLLKPAVRGATATPVLVFALTGATAAWSLSLLQVWGPWDTYDFGHGPHSAIEPAVGLSLLAALVFFHRRAEGRARTALAAAIVAFALIELKATGTSRRFNGSVDIPPPSVSLVVPGVDEAVQARMLRDSVYRTAVSEEGGPPPVTLRHFGLATPQGFDPLITTAFHGAVEESGGKFSSDRLFSLDPGNVEGLRRLGVKYFAAPELSVEHPKLKAAEGLYAFTGAKFSYFKVYELISPQPAYRLPAGGTATAMEWLPARRVLDVDAATAGTFQLTEQFFPGWTASIDGSPVEVSRCDGAFQCIAMPRGRHRVEFVYRSMSLRLGSLVSVLSAVALALWGRRGRVPAVD